MVVFNGSAKIRVVEARDLRPTEWSKRFNSSDTETAQQLDAYVNVDMVSLEACLPKLQFIPPSRTNITSDKPSQSRKHPHPYGMKIIR